MPMPLIDFESSRDRDRQRLQQQQARKQMLEKVRAQHEATQRSHAAAVHRGENTWVLPAVDAAIRAQEGGIGGSNKKKSKDKKKHKKDKKKKKHKRRSSSSSKETSEDEWVEKSGPPSAALPAAFAEDPQDSRDPQDTKDSTPPKREDWMEMSSLFVTYTRDELRQREGGSRVVAKQKEKNKQPDKPGCHALELNPYYKDGGSGLPQERPRQQVPGPSFGASAAWLRKALQRAKEQAQEEGVPLEEIAATRWGSLDNFNEMLEAAEQRDRAAQQQQWRPQHRDGCVRPSTRASPGIRTRQDHDKGREQDYRDAERQRRGGHDSREERRKTARSKSSSSDSRSGSKGRSKVHRSSNTGSSSSSGSRHRNHSSRKRSSRKHSGSRSSSSSGSERRYRKQDWRRERSRSGSRDRTRQGASHSPDGGRPRRLMRAPDDDSDKHQTASQDRPECAVWDTTRVLASKRAPVAGNWRKKAPAGGVGADGGPRDAGRPRRSRSSSSNDSKDRSESSFRRRSPAHRQLLKPGENRGVVSTITSTDQHESRVAPASSGGSRTAQGVDAVSRHAEETKNGGQRQDAAPESVERTAAKPVKMYTEHELNELGAKVVKAELMGNQALADKLKKKLAKARKETEETPKAGLTPGANVSAEKTEEEVLLTTTNIRGLTRPVQSLEDESPSGSKKSRKRPKVSTVDASGQRDKYFPDDHKFSLKQMFEREKLSGTEESDAMFVRAAAKSQRAALDDEYTLDDAFVDRGALREGGSGDTTRDRLKAIMDHQRREKALAACLHCCDSSRMQKHLIVSLGSKSYLSLPFHQSLVDGHCLIVPREHLATSTLLDEDAWEEMKSYRQSLVRFFASRGEDVLFLECCMRLGSQPHTVLHCIPVPRDMGDLAPIYYKKAIQESESEWSQNVKLVELKGRDVRRAIPKGFPYFCVDFGSSPGYAHVIEDEAIFPQYFGQSVVGGMLDLEPQLWRKPRHENFDEQRRKVLAFARQYEHYDPAPLTKG